MLRIASMRSAAASRMSATMPRSTGAPRARLVGSRRIEISFVPGAGALAVAVAEVEQHVDLARIAHVAQQRSEIERMPRRERLRPEAERSRLAGDRQAEQLGELDQLLVGAAPGDLVADAHQRVLRLEQHARGLLDVVLVGTDAHRHVELRLVPDRRRSPPPRSVLVGSERKTGPQGEVEANFMPRRVVSGIAAVVFAAQYHLVIGCGHDLAVVGLLRTGRGRARPARPTRPRPGSESGPSSC